MRIRNTILVLCACACLCARGGDLGQAVVLSQAGRKLLLDSCETYVQAGMQDVKRWQAFEGSIAREEFDGRQCLHFHVDVDHKGGDATYPIGWPRTYFYPRADEQVWGKYEAFDCSVYVKQKNGTTPRNAFNININQVDKKNIGRKFFFTTDLKMNEWNKLNFHLTQVAEGTQMRNLGVIITESDFDDGDSVDIYVADLCFRRATRSAIGALRVEEPILTTDSRVLPVELDVLGDGKGGIPFQLLKDGKPFRNGSLSVKSGFQTVRMDVSEWKLSPGDYTLVFFPDEKDFTLSAPVRVIPSPWSEAK